MTKKKRLKIVLLILVFLFLALILGGGVYMFLMKGNGRYFSGTTINGYDVADLEPEEAASILEKTYKEASVVIREKGEPSVSGSLEDFGYKVDEEALKRMLSKALNEQRNSFGTLFHSLAYGNTFVMQVPFTVDEQKLLQKASVQSLKEERVQSKDAYLDYDEEKYEYRIVPEVYGNEFPEEQMQSLVQAGIESFTQERQAGEQLTVDIPEDIYETPSVTAEDPDLTTRCTVYNSFCKASVTYEFGSQTETLGWDRIRDWIIISGTEGSLNEGDVREFVTELENRYNTRYLDRVFHTSFGTDVTIPGSLNEYGYRINEDAEVQQLVSDIYANAAVSREPVYYSVNSDYGNPLYYHREGRDDLAGTYVEVNLSAQHLWFYKNGGLVVECDIVSGSVAKGAETQTGAFPLAYKESPSVLVGTNAADGYQTKVQYWMPFYEGQGLHDATWRGAFGGSIYQSSGSHGCVNLPYWAAEQIYNNIDAGVAIILYK